MSYLSEYPVAFTKCLKKEFLQEVNDIEYNARVKMQKTMPVIIIEEDNIIKENTVKCFKGLKKEFLGTLYGLKLYSYYHIFPKSEMFKWW